uniref:F-box domain-containing protein n=1 Tax=Chenopodium quinoa TaxID=63459 RepID=A0A803M508_CHEQI
MRTKPNSLIDEKYCGIEKRQMSLIKTVLEKAAKLQTCLTPSLPNDLIFQIFLKLPIKSILRFTCVCKAWYKLIHCAEFVSAYNAHAQNTPVILRRIYGERSNTFHAEAQLNLSINFSLFPCSLGSRRRSKFIYFLEIENEKGKLLDLYMSCYGSVVSSCNGLILITSKHEVLGRYRDSSLDQPLVDSKENPGQLIVMNPMTRKLIGFPLGTLPFKLHDESYGLVFSHSKGVYKVVHLFKDKSGCIACEILSLQTRSWKAVDGPVGVLFRNFGQAPIPTVGALHWLLGSFGYDYIISMKADDENFFITDLPKTMDKYDRLVAMGGSLSFVNGLDKDHIEVWILKGLEGTKWVKQHTILIDASLGLDYVVYGDVDYEEHVNVDDEEHGNEEIEGNEEHGNEDNEEHDNVDDEDNGELLNLDNEQHVNVGDENNEGFGFVDNDYYSLSCFALNAKEMVFRRRDKLFAYDFELEEIREIRMDRGKFLAHDTIIPHANNLATWEPLESMR